MKVISSAKASSSSSSADPRGSTANVTQTQPNLQTPVALSNSQAIAVSHNSQIQPTSNTLVVSTTLQPVPNVVTTPTSLKLATSLAIAQPAIQPIAPVVAQQNIQPVGTIATSGQATSTQIAVSPVNPIVPTQPQVPTNVQSVQSASQIQNASLNQNSGCSKASGSPVQSQQAIQQVALSTITTQQVNKQLQKSNLAQNNNTTPQITNPANNVLSNSACKPPLVTSKASNLKSAINNGSQSPVNSKQQPLSRPKSPIQQLDAFLPNQPPQFTLTGSLTGNLVQNVANNLLTKSQANSKHNAQAQTKLQTSHVLPANPLTLQTAINVSKASSKLQSQKLHRQAANIILNNSQLLGSRSIVNAVTQLANSATKVVTKS